MEVTWKETEDVKMDTLSIENGEKGMSPPAFCTVEAQLSLLS